jgi:Ca2+-binding RTX toxin-like protein
MGYVDFYYIKSRNLWKFQVELDWGAGMNFYNYYSWHFETIWATPTKAEYVGGSGSDSIYLFARGENTAWGNDGNDRITVSYGGGEARNKIYAGTGNDTVDCSSSRSSNTIWGGAGNDTLRGGSAADTFIDTIGRNDIYGNGGNDRITIGSAGENRSRIYGGDGDDEIRADRVLPSNDVDIYGGSGNDDIDVRVNSSTVKGDANNDAINIRGWGNSIYGDDGNDTIDIVGSHNRVYGGDGKDKIEVRNSDGAGASVFGGDGDDIITFKNNNGGTIYGGLGRDKIDIENSKNVKIGYTCRCAGRDEISNFDGSDGNKLDFSALNIQLADLNITQLGTTSYMINVVGLNIVLVNSFLTYDDIII